MRRLLHPLVVSANLALAMLSGCKTQLWEKNAPPEPPEDALCEGIPNFTRANLAHLLQECLTIPPLPCTLGSDCCASSDEKTQASPDEISAFENLCVEGKIGIGTPPFRPSGLVDRREFAVAVARALEVPEVPPSTPDKNWWGAGFRNLDALGLVPASERTDENKLQCPPSEEFIRRVRDYCAKSGRLVLRKAPNSPSGSIPRGPIWGPSEEVVLASFEAKALGEDIELQEIALDLSGGTDRTGSQDVTGPMECSIAKGCDLTGTVKISTGEKKLLSVIANKPLLWDGNGAYVRFPLATYLTIPADEQVVLEIKGTVSMWPNVGSGETIQANIGRVNFRKRESGIAGHAPGASGNIISVE